MRQLQRLQMTYKWKNEILHQWQENFMDHIGQGMVYKSLYIVLRKVK